MAVTQINKGAILEAVQESQIKKDIPNFGPGDTIIVYNRIIEGKKSRIQRFEGVVLRRKGSGASETCIVRKESSSIGVELCFDINSPLVEKIELIRRGKVRRAYIAYMRKRSGRSARIKEKISK